MPPSNKIVFASAGAGKTTEIVTQALSMRPRNIAITTFTLKNVEEIRRKLIELNGCVPPEITIYPWYTFVLHESWCAHIKAALIESASQAFTSPRAPNAYLCPEADVAQYYCYGKTKRIPIALAILPCYAMGRVMGKSFAG